MCVLIKQGISDSRYMAAAPPFYLENIKKARHYISQLRTNYHH